MEMEMEIEIEQERDILLKAGERIDALLWHDFKIIQNKDWFCFGLDAVLLADFAKLEQGEQVLDLCTGNGVIPLLLAAKESTAMITGIELFPEVVEMAERSAQLNHLSRRVKIQAGDICKIQDLVAAHSYQVVTVNPPYRKIKTGRLSASPLVAAAKTEIFCDLSQVVTAVAYSLAAKGRFYLVYPYERLVALLSVLQSLHLQVHCLTLVKNFSSREPFLCLVSGMGSIQADNRLDKLKKRDFIIFQENRTYTPEMTAIFQKYQTGKEI